MGRQTQGFLDVMGLGGGGSVSPSEGKQGKLPPGVTNPHDESLYGNGKALIFEIIKDIVVGIITSVLYDKWKEPPPIQPDNSNHTIGDSPSGGVPDPAPTPAPPTPPASGSMVTGDGGGGGGAAYFSAKQVEAKLMSNKTPVNPNWGPRSVELVSSSLKATPRR